MSVKKVILLLGRRDEPTDGVADYCEKLRETGLPRGLSFEPTHIRWAEKGWSAALAELRKTAAGWRDCWVLLQYTTLAWSRRGFPLRVPRLLEILRQSGVRPGVVFHDFLPAQGSGIVGGVRAFLHLRVLRQLFANSDLAVFTVPLKTISWLPPRRETAAFIPVGANCAEVIHTIREESPRIKFVAVYSITGGAQASIEVVDLGIALKRANQAAGPIRLLLFGRGSREAESALRAELAGADMEIESLGLLSPVEIQQVLARADVLLFVRGQISTRRGSAIAGIACGLPIVCYSGSETSWPITEAGILAAPHGDRESLAAALENVLADSAFRKTLAERSRIAHAKYFSWAAITGRFAEELQLRDNVSAAEGSGETHAVARI